MVSVSVEDLEQVHRLMLYVLNNNGKQPVGNTHLQKIMFQTIRILGKNPKSLKYEPNKFGPYSSLVEEKKRNLKDTGYLEEKRGRYYIHSDAEKEISKIKPPSESIGFKLGKISSYLSNLDDDELLLYIYVDDLNNTNGEYLTKSEVKDDILKRRVEIATGMYLGKKVSLEMGSELAGMKLSDFQDYLVKRLGIINVY